MNQVSGRVFDKLLREYEITDLNSAQGRILFVLWQSGSQPISELARKTALSKTTLTSMLERLEQAGHILRQVNEADKRETIVSLTEKSVALQGRYDAVSAEMLRLYYDGLPEQEIDRFEHILRHILKNLTEYEQKNKDGN
ncbi:MarR family winged helix-turn-helix transcriptional regulator [Acetanaerobacterium elongatum]|uniref:MarR family winged helix-turn-helix transcriptional regulator n=1 Tax=Acetanaerobacterium elongatum TaxID=258515 RepID=UPI001FA7E8CB|nr:MarR family transcriptional regulator [Acetanaerobacterium elongatum]